MNQTTRRALRATAAVAGMATAFGLPGTAFAATATHDGPAREQAPNTSALGGHTAPAAAPSSSDLHTFALPTARSIPVDNKVSSPEDASSSTDYTSDEDDSPGYTDRHRSSERDRQNADANQDDGDASYPDCSPQNDPHAYNGFGYNGDKSDDGDYDSDDYDPSCTGYHPPQGANSYDDDQYAGTDKGRRHDQDYQFGGLI